MRFSAPKLIASCIQGCNSASSAGCLLVWSVLSVWCELCTIHVARRLLYKEYTSTPSYHSIRKEQGFLRSVTLRPGRDLVQNVVQANIQRAFVSLPVTLFVIQNVAPVPEKPIITVHEAVARKMLKLRAKLGITADDLLPASISLEPERSSDQQGPPAGTHRSGAHCGQETAVTLEGHVNSGLGPASAVSNSRVATSGAADIGRWKQEADDMLSLLGTSAERCTHQYPMTELKRKVIAIPECRCQLPS